MIRRHNAREKTSLRAYVTAELRRDELFKVLANIAKEHPNKRDPRVTTKQFERDEELSNRVYEPNDSEELAPEEDRGDYAIEAQECC